MIECTVAGEKLVLLAERAVFWPAKKALFVADFHLGKAASFRRAGIPLPSGTTTENAGDIDMAGCTGEDAGTGRSSMATDELAAAEVFIAIAWSNTGTPFDRDGNGTGDEKILLSTAFALAAAAGEALAMPLAASRLRTREIRSCG